MHKFFVEKSQIKDGKAFISGKDFKHINRVLRLKEGEEIIISSEGKSYLSILDEIRENEVVFNMSSKPLKSSEAPIDIVLYQGFPKGSKMEYIVQKGTEIGIKDFHGVLTHRTIVKFKDDKKKNSKIERLNSIIVEAAKQSKRDYIPKVEAISGFQEMIEKLKDEENIIVPYEDEENNSFKDALKAIKGEKINLIIGPEGGFEKEEIEKLKDIGAKTVSLGPRILRTETAGVVAASIILYELGDLGVSI